LAINLIVSGVTYTYPTTNTELWGSSASDWAQAVTNALQQVTVTGDIGPGTLVTIANNQATPANVTNLIVNPALIRAAAIEYYVIRTASGVENSESGTLYMLYNDTSADWGIANVGVNVDTTGVAFTVNASGQVKYTSNNLAGQTSGKMKYRVRVLQKT
jgi:hypothetical protein